MSGLIGIFMQVVAKALPAVPGILLYLHHHLWRSRWLCSTAPCRRRQMRMEWGWWMWRSRHWSNPPMPQLVGTWQLWRCVGLVTRKAGFEVNWKVWTIFAGLEAAAGLSLVHQPSQRPLRPREPRSTSGVYLCGDHCAEPTLDSAMRSGRLAAEAVLKAWR